MDSGYYEIYRYVTLERIKLRPLPHSARFAPLPVLSCLAILLSLPPFSAAALAQVSCVVTITSPASGTAIAGTQTVNMLESCSGGAPGFKRLYVGPVGSTTILTASFDFPPGPATLAWNTTSIPNGSYHLNVIEWDATGSIKEGGTTQDTIVTISNVAGGSSLPTFSVICPPGFPCPASGLLTFEQGGQPVTANAVFVTSAAAPTATPSRAPTATPSRAPAATPAPTRTASPAPTSTATPAASATPTPVLGGAVMKANDFLNTMGAVTHDIQKLESATAIINGFRYTGLRIGRDDATHSSSGAGSVQDLCNIHAATGVKYHELPIVDDGDASVSDTRAMWDQLAGCGGMLEAEGPNEPNNGPFFYAGATCSMGSSFLPCAHYQADLYKMVKSDPLLRNFRVAGLTEPGAEPDNVGLQFLAIPSGSGLAMPDGTVYADIANTHNYVQGNGTAGTTLMDNHARLAETIQAGPFDHYGNYWGATWNRQFAGASSGQNARPKETTETGWNIYKPGANIGWDMMARLVTDVFLDAPQLGWSETIVYKMFEEPPYDTGNGMFNRNGDEADAGNATALGLYIHNLTAILSDNSSAFSATPVALSLSGLPPTGYYQLMQKSSGVHELVLWGEAFASRTASTVTVTLPKTAASIKVYDITSGTAPIQSLTNAASVRVTLTDHAVIVEF